MNKKSRTRILIVIVAALWGYNIYRTVVNYQVKSESLEVQQNNTLNFAPISFNKDTFNLKFPNHDPFLGNQLKWRKTRNSFASTTSAGANPNVPVKKVVETPPVSVSWPKIDYYGYLMKHEVNHKLCILSINGKSYRLSVGEVQDDLRVVMASKDSVKIEFSGESRSFPKL